MMTITRTDAMSVAEVEDARFLDLVRTLTDEEWRTPTCCDGWDVRAMVAHVVGAAEGASMREMAHQLRIGSKVARQRGLPAMVDGINEVQIAERSSLGTAELVDRLAAAQPSFRRSRKRLPAPLRAVRIPADPVHGKVSLGQLMDVVYTRDTWMHRVDICGATGRDLELTPEHDGRIVADVVAEWAGRHGAAYDLTLTGPAGGHWSSGTDGERIEMDALDFCLVMAGRAPGTGLLATTVLF